MQNVNFLSILQNKELGVQRPQAFAFYVVTVIDEHTKLGSKKA